MQSKEHKQVIRMAKTFLMNMLNPQDKAVWHNLKVAVLNTLILKKCHRWLRHWKCTQHSEEAHYFPYFFFYSHSTRVLKGCMADKLDATAGEFCLSSKVTCSKRCAFCSKPNDTQLVWLQGRWSKNTKCWSLISSLHHNQNPEKSRIQITPSEFGLTYTQQNCPDIPTVVNRVNAVLILLHFNDQL